MSFRYLSLFFFILILFGGCEEVIELDLPKGYKRLVVDGWITTEPGPYRIKLTKSTYYTLDFSDTVIYEKGAVVLIQDDLGNTDTLTEKGPGIYETDSSGIKGEIGRSYSLKIKTTDGREFASIPELIKAGPEIDSIYSQYIIETDPARRSGLGIFIRYNDPPNEKNYYYYNVAVNGKLFQLFDNNLDITSDKYFNGNTIDEEVTRVTYWGDPEFTFKIALLSLSKEAYFFLSLVKSQTENVESRYAPPPAPIIGNIYNVNDKKDYALGFFGASAITTAEIKVNQGSLPKGEM